MITHRRAAATLVAFAMSTTSAWAANACVQDQDLIALRATALQQQLMVAGYSCHEAGEYNRFVEIYRSQLLSSDAALMAFFIHRNAATGSDDYNAFKTKLANIAALRSANDTDAFCGHARTAFRAALSTEKASLRDLVGVTPDAGQTVCQAGVKTASAAPAPKPAAVVAAVAPSNPLADVPVPRSELKAVPMGAPQTLTAQKLAELYPNDPPPFSLPTTPPTANEPPVAAPTTRVAVDSLAKPAAPQAHAVQEAQAEAPAVADGLDAAAPVEDLIAAAPAFAQMAAAPADLAADAVAQKQSMALAGTEIAANTVGKLAQVPEAAAAAAPADALSDAEMQAAALSGIGAAEAAAPPEAPPTEAAPRAIAPRYAAVQPQYANPDAYDEDADNAPPPPAPSRGQYATRPDARVASNDDDLYGEDRDEDRYAPPPQPQRQARSTPSSYRYYSDRYGNHYAEDSRGQQYYFDPRRGRWQPVDDGYNENSYQPTNDPRYAYSPYYRNSPPGYYGR
jgi:hypothetical protein